MISLFKTYVQKCAGLYYIYNKVGKRLLSGSYEVSTGIYAEEYKEEEGKSPETGASITEERQWDSDDRSQSEHHSHIDKDVEKEYAQDAIAIDSPEFIWLSLSYVYQSQDESKEKEQYSGTSHEAFFLAYGAEYEVSVLLRHEFQFGLSAIEEAFSFQSARADGYLTLMDIISGTGKVLLQTEKHIDTHALVGLHHMIEHIVCGIEEGDTAESKEHDKEILPYPLLQYAIEQIAYHRCTEDELHPHYVERNDVFSKQQRAYCDAYAVAEDRLGSIGILTIDPYQCGGKYLYHKKYGEMAHRCRYIPDGRFGISDADDEIDNHRHAREKEAARHSFAVEHQEEAGIDQCAAGLLLHHYQYHRREDNGQAEQEVAPA